mgnify:CR=1 FL=1
MKKQLLVIVFCLISNLFAVAQSTNDILNLLIANKTITQEQADSIRAEAAIKQQDVETSKKSFFVTAAKQIQLSGYVQMRYQNLDEKGKIDGFDLRRARLDLKGSITPYWNIRFQVDLAGSSPKLIDAYGECKIASYFNITLGQFLLPIFLENTYPTGKLEIIDLSQVSEALAARSNDVIGNQNGRDIGIQLNGSFIKINDHQLFDYYLGVFNGSGINTTDKNEAKSLAGRFLIHPIKGLDAGCSIYSGWDYFGSTPKSQKRNRFGCELKYDLKQFSLRWEYIKGHDGDVKRIGWYVQSGYFIIPQKLQLILKYDTFDPQYDKSNDYCKNYSIVANYAFNSWTRVQVGYTIREEQGPNINNNIGVIQYQIGF